MTTLDFIKLAQTAIAKTVTEHHGNAVTEMSVEIVWYAHILGNKKCIGFVPQLPGHIYEVTFNSAKNEIYVDSYDKATNTIL